MPELPSRQFVMMPEISDVPARADAMTFPAAKRLRFDRLGLLWLLAIIAAFNALSVVTAWKVMMSGANDFPIFYSNAQMVREGRAADLYNFDAENIFIRRVSSTTRPPNNHVPYELLLFVPLAFLPYDVAYIVWGVVGLFMLGGVAFLMRDVGEGRPGFWPAFLTLLAFFPIWYCLANGQDSILLLFVFAASFWLWRQRRESLAGFVLALALFRPQLALPFLFVTAVAGKRKFLRGFVIGAGLVGALSVLVVGWHGIVEYLRLLGAQGLEQSSSTLVHEWGISPELMPTWRGFLWMLLPGSTPSMMRNVLILAGTVAGLFWAGKCLRRSESQVCSDQAFAVAIAVVALVSFHSFLYDFSLMVLPLLYVTSQRWSSPDLSSGRALRLSIVSLFFVTPLYLLIMGTNTVALFFIPGALGLWAVKKWDEGRMSISMCDRYASF